MTTSACAEMPNAPTKAPTEEKGVNKKIQKAKEKGEKNTKTTEKGVEKVDPYAKYKAMNVGALNDIIKALEDELDTKVTSKREGDIYNLLDALDTIV